MSDQPLRSHRRPLKYVIAGGIIAALGLTGLGAALGGMFTNTAVSIPFVDPVYQIETESNGHHGSLLNLQLGQPGVPQVPVPVDVDGDLLPDVHVAVNLVDISGLVNNPPNPGAILAPNIEIIRDPTAAVRCLPLSILDKCSPPLKIQVRLVVKDLGNLEEDKVLRFGYDTGNNGSLPNCAQAPCTDDKGRIGSIPPYFKATLGGLDDFFNPITATMSTRGSSILGQAGNNLDLTRVPNGYDGPLDIVGSLGRADGITSSETGLLTKLANLLDPRDDVAADLRFSYRPWPGDVKVSFGSDDSGQHVRYEHERKDQVDLDTRIALFNRTGNVVDADVYTARVDRLPRRIGLDFNLNNQGGSARYDSTSDGRLPDVHIGALSEKLQVMTKTEARRILEFNRRLELRLAGANIAVNAHLFLGLGEEEVDVAMVPIEAPLFADADIEALPARVGADWSIPASGPASALFCAGQITAGACDESAVGIGAAEADIRNYYGHPTKLSSFVPTEQQHVTFQTAQGGEYGTESHIRGRVDRLRELSFNQADNGFDAGAKVGDGELPLQVHVESDDRTDTTGSRLLANAVISPLPDTLTASLREAGADERTQPLELRYTASKSIDVDSHLELAKPGTPPTPQCGKKNTVCADFKARHLPAEITTRVRSFESTSDIGSPGQTFDESRIEIDAIPRQGGSRPDFFADLVVGQDNPSPAGFEGDLPLSAHAELLGYPEFVRIRTREGLDEGLDRVEFHACDRQFDLPQPACRQGTENGRVGSVSFTARNWLSRPADLPILVPASPLYATVAARGVPTTSDVVLFEASGKVTDIAELQLRNTGKTIGVRSRIGGGKDLTATADIGNVDLDGDDAAAGRIDLRGETLISPLPGNLDFCLRQAHEQLENLVDTFTDPCENANPFNDPGPLTESPTSVAYRADSNFTVSGEFQLTQRGLDPGIADDHRVKAMIKVENLPKEVTAHLQAPKSGVRGPIRAIYNGPTNGPPLTVDFAGEATDGDLVCADPRTPTLGKKALCAEGRIENLPKRTFISYDPTQRQNNLIVDTDSQINLTGIPPANPADPPRKFTISSVEAVPRPAANGPTVTDLPEINPEDLIVEANITNIPRRLTGTVDLPGTIEVAAEPPIGAIDAEVRNFIAPDPLPAAEPVRDIKPGLSVGPNDPNLSKVVFFGRKDTDTDRLLFRATARITDIVGFGYRNAMDANRNLLDTKTISVDFARNKTIRAYADVDTGAEQVIGDVTLPNVPAGTTVCFRGKKKTAFGPPVNPTFCDRAPQNDEQGAFQVLQRPNPPVGELDVHAYLRAATGGGADVLSGRVDIENIPKVVQGTFGGGTTDVGGFSGLNPDGVGVNKDGIDQIGFHLATFDITDHGYPTPGFDPRPVTTAPFPALRTNRQHIGLASTNADFELAGRIGEVEPSAVPGSDLQRILVRDVPCDKPQGAGSRPDFPFYPDRNEGGPNKVWDYTCIRGEFEEVGPDAPDPLDVNAIIEKDGERTALTGAGLTEIPQFIQLNLAEGPTLVPGDDPLRPLRPVCRSVAVPNCAPPFVRFDTPGDSVLFGTLELGKVEDLVRLQGVTPRDTAPDFDAAPGADGCGWAPQWDACNPADTLAGPKGIRVKAGTVEVDGGDSRTAVKAGVRLRVPPSLTIDQIQSWSASKAENKENYFDASDLRFRATVRDAEGTIIPSLGELAAFINAFPGGDQTLITDAARGPTRGIPIPGDVGMGLFVRDDKGEGRKLIQFDGRLSVTENIQARILPGDTDTPKVDAKVLDIPATEAGDGEDKPSFRLRAEIDGEGADPPAPAKGSSAKSGFGTAADPPKEENCSILYCLETQVDLKTVTAAFDFKPDGNSTSVRLIEAAVRKDGIRNGAQVIGWDTVEGGGQKTEFAANIDVLVQPINVFLHAGIPIIGSFDFVLLSDLRAGAAVRTNELTIRQNLLHVNADAAGPGLGVGGLFEPCTGISCLYVDYRIYQLHGIAFSIIGLLWGDPIILGVDFLPPSLPRLPGPVDILGQGTAVMSFLPCVPDLTPVPGGQNRIRLGDTFSGDVVVWPLSDPRFISYGTLKPVFDIISDFAGPVFCFFPTTESAIPLINGGNPGDADHIPGDPIDILTHPVPDADQNPPGVAAAKVAQPAADPGPSTLTIPTGQTIALCGSHAFDSVDIQTGATLAVATVADNTPVVADGPARCVAGGEGTLSLTAGGSSLGTGGTPNPGKIIVAGTIQAGPTGPLKLVADDIIVSGTIVGGKGKVVIASSGNLSVPGQVRANAVYDTVPAGGTTATGNSGGGHGAAGGNGSSPSGGGAFGDGGFVPAASDGLIPTEGGSPGSTVSAAAPGRGGGALTLIAGNELRVTGSVQANGSVGTPAANSSCATGTPGAGGGAGGGILLAAPKVDILGSVSARGGDGGTGKGGGGGGAGGRVKIKSPLVTGTPDLIHGNGGVSGCADVPAGTNGGDGNSPRDTQPISNAVPFLQFWRSGNPQPVSYNAAAAVSGLGGDDFQVVLCGVHIAPDRPDVDGGDQGNDPDGLGPALRERMPAPGTVTVGNPCGNTGTQLGVKKLTNTTRSPAGDTINATLPLPSETDALLRNGYWGVWTTVLKPAVNDRDCTNPLQAPNSGCTLEPTPAAPEATFGWDNNAPTFDLSTNLVGPPLITRDRNIMLNVTAPVDDMKRNSPPPSGAGPRIPLSGIREFRCSNDGANFVPCGAGTFAWQLPDGDATTTITVVAIDHAGNSTTRTVDVILDTKAPQAQAKIRTQLPPGVQKLNNGWYSGSPHFELFGFSEPDGSPSSGFGRYVFRFDEGGDRVCTTNPCVIQSELPGPGRHKLFWYVEDKLGNRSPTSSLDVKIDGQAPLVDFRTVPKTPGGANQWFTATTFGAISTFDQPPGGSGLRLKPDDPPSDGSPFGVFFGIDGPAVTPYTVPFAMPAGTHTVCFKAIDVAGNTSGQSCSGPIRVDLAPPSVALTPVPGAPDGANGWYVTTPTVRVTTSDTQPGSGVDPSFDDLADLCTGRKPAQNPNAPSGTCVSIDGGAYQPHLGGSLTIPEGLHEVRAFAVDVSGQRSPVTAAAFKVDLSHAVSAARVLPPDPARAEWWRRTPTVVLRATDGERNAGVSGIEYFIDGTGPIPYTGPFRIPPGVHQVTYRALDHSGRAEPNRVLTVPVDIGPAVVTATEAQPLIWLLPPLGPQNAQLKWTVRDDFSDKVHATVIIYNALGAPVRRIVEPGPRTITPGAGPQEFSTAWDGKDDSLLGLVPIGVYYYRVVITDEAGNVSQSGESRPIQLKLLGGLG